MKIVAKTVAVPMLSPNPVTPLAAIHPLKPPTDPEEFLKYNYGVKQGVESSLSGTADAVMHPIRTVENVAYAVTHLDEVCAVIAPEVAKVVRDDIIFGDNEDHGRVVGFLAAEYITLKGVSKVTQVGKVKLTSLAGEAKLLLFLK